MPDGNPYARMVAIMRGGGAETAAGETGGAVKMRLGTVAQRAPLEIIVAGVRQPAETLRINSQLGLEAGDAVLLLTEDDQVFYILMKVVNAV